jgi:hypothetical protein
VSSGIAAYSSVDLQVRWLIPIDGTVFDFDCGHDLTGDGIKDCHFTTSGARVRALRINKLIGVCVCSFP